jgi:hypothetical protein
MTIRHAAVLALVGWYLMVPPALIWKKKAMDAPDNNAPLSKWQIYSSHDSAKECEKAARVLRESYKAKHDNGELWGWSINCIATDDPRLKCK